MSCCLPAFSALMACIVVSFDCAGKMEFEPLKELHVSDFNHKRCRLLTKCAVPSGHGPVLYWMSREQRVQGLWIDAHETWERYVFIKTCTHTYMHTDNWALIYAQKLAMKRSVPLMVCFCLVPKFLDATIRQFGFMLKGLREVEQVRTIIQSPSSVDCHSFRTAFSRAQLNLSSSAAAHHNLYFFKKENVSALMS